MPATLFGQMALRFGTQPENLATEALGFILRRSGAARAGLTDLLRPLGTAIPSALAFRNQDSVDGEGIPDIVGADLQGVLRLVLEAKFWAGLTVNQPVAYLDRLPEPGGTLLFVAPARRLEILWAELHRRCAHGGQGLTNRPVAGSWKSAGTPNGRIVALTSWNALLAGIEAETQRQGDAAASADLTQLRGLIDEVDRDAFLPVRPEELTTTVYRRALDFVNLVAPIVDRLEAEHVATRDGRLTHGPGWTSFKIRLPGAAGVEASLSCDLWAWMQRAPTPFWLKLDGPHRAAIQLALVPLDAGAQRVFDDNGAPYVAVFVPTGAEQHQIIDEIVADIRSVALLVPPAPAPPTPATAPPPARP